MIGLIKKANHVSKNLPHIQTNFSDLSISEKFLLAASLSAVAVFSFPGMATAQVKHETPFVFQIQNPHYLTMQIQNLPIADDYPEEYKQFSNYPKDDRVPVLEEYLRSKGSPIAEHANLVLKNKHYRLILAISFAEGNFCKHQIRAYNCWGIGGTKPETYANYDEAFQRADNLIQKYQDRGMTSAETMRTTWVGWHNDSWIVAVNQVLDELKEIGL